jgi:hypothetical protein
VWRKITGKKLKRSYRKCTNGTMGKKRKSCRGNINRVEVGDGRKTKRKGSRRRVHGKKKREGMKKKNKRQSGERRGEEADRVDRRKWMGSAERE